jgi:zinc transport system substrate-binding protein
MFDADDDGNLSLSEFTSFMEISNDGQDDHDDHDETMMMEMMFNMTDANSDGFVNASELEMLMEMGDDGHDDEQHGVIGFANLHVEEEGQYGFLLPSDVTMHVLASRDAHEGHGHEDHDDHVDEDRDREEHEGHDDHDEHDEITEEDCERRNGTWEEDPDHIGEFHCDLGQGDHDEHDEEERDGHDDHAEHDEHSEEIPYDPHSWLDPVAFKSQIDVVLEALVTAFPSGEADFTANADAYKIQLDSISAGFENAFGEGGTCTADKTVVANHNAYSYLAQRYDIEFVTIHGVDAEGEPSAEDIVEVVETINEEQITVLFVEEFTDPTSVESIVTQTGVTVLYLYTMEMPPSSPGEDYLSLMQKNLENLIIGIGC